MKTQLSQCHKKRYITYFFYLTFLLISTVGYTQDFITTWNTETRDSGNATITLPITEGAYDVDFNNDGIYNDTDAVAANLNNLTGTQTITFASPGVYTIRIRSNPTNNVSNQLRIVFNNSNNGPKLTTIEQWGNIVWTSMENAFFGCNNVNIDENAGAPNLSMVTNMSNMFNKAYLLDQSLNHWNVSTVTNMKGLFRTASIFNGNINDWDVSNVTNMAEMFDSASNFNQPLNNWNVSNVTNMAGMFVGASNFNQSLNNWNVSKVTDMSTMFFLTTSFNGDISNWNTGAVTNMASMLSAATVFNGDISNWNTASVTNMSHMFSGASVFNGDISNWNTASVTNMFGTFSNINASYDPDVRNWNVSNVTNMYGLFSGAASFNRDLSNWNVSNVTNMRYMFANATNFNGNISSWNISNVTDMQGLFQGASNYSSNNYDSLLTNWGNLTPKSNVKLTAPPTTYCSGESGRNILTATYDWDISGDNGKDCTITFTGATNNDWNTTSNWDKGTIPTSINDVVINTDSELSASGNIDGNTLTLHANSSLTVSGNVLISGSITINSGASIIAQNSTPFNITYKRNLATTNWYLVSPPVTDETMESLISNNSFATGTGSNIGIGDYVNTTPGWTYATSSATGALTSGEGRTVKLTSAGDISFTGAMPLSDVSISISNGGTDGNDFNLIGNPFPSYLPINHTSPSPSNNILRANTGILKEETVWFWDQSGNEGAGTYAQINHASAFVHGIRHIPPGQGFFVKSNETGGNFIFPQSIQNHQSTDAFSRTSASTNSSRISLYLKENGAIRSTEILYIPNTTTSWDNGYDSTTFNESDTSFDIYTHLVANSQGQNIGIQSLPNENYEDMVIPIGVHANSETTIQFNIEASNIPEGINMYLEDKETNTFTRLNESGDIYSVYLTENLDGIGRFYLHTTPSTLHVQNETLNNVSVYLVHPNTVRIAGIHSGNTKLQLYSVLGKLILEKQFIGNSVNDIPVSQIASGMYIIKIKNERGILTKKILLN